MKLYVYDKAMLGDDGTDFTTALCAEIHCDTEAECLAKFEADYGSNDYSCSFTRP